MNKYLIYDQNAHTQVFVVQADNEEQAWDIYLAEEQDYIQRGVGYVRKERVLHEDLEDVFIVYGLLYHPDGTVTMTDGHRVDTLEEAFQHFNVVPQEDGTYFSYDECYKTRSEALSQLAPLHRLEMQEFHLNEEEAFQCLFFSKDELAYLSTATKEDIAFEHHWQSARYVAIGDMLSAIEEEKKSLELLTKRRSRLVSQLDIAGLYFKIEAYDKAAEYYKMALEGSNLYDNIEAISAGLAEARIKINEAIRERE